MKKTTYQALYNAKVIKELTVPLDEYKATPEERRFCKVSGTDKGIIYESVDDMEEMNLLLRANQTMHLRTIKHSMVFFVLLTVINLICTLVLLTQ